VGLAQALVHNPEVLVLDEPTVGLDPEQIIEVRGLIKSLAGEHTVILSTHILSEVSATCERVIIIGQRPFYTEEEPRRAYLAGTIVAQDTIANLTHRMAGAGQLYLQVEGPGEQVLNKLAQMSGVKHVAPSHTLNGNLNRFDVIAEDGRDIRAELAQAVVQNGWGLLELRAKDLSLEEAFLKLTQEA
jgi:ABC-2 type transport system ATP-binding protein